MYWEKDILYESVEVRLQGGVLGNVQAVHGFKVCASHISKLSIGQHDHGP